MGAGFLLVISALYLAAAVSMWKHSRLMAGVYLTFAVSNVLLAAIAHKALR